MPNLIQYELTDACIQAIIRNDNLVVQVLQNLGINNSQGLIDHLVAHRDLSFTLFENLARDSVGINVYAEVMRITQCMGCAWDYCQE